VVAKGVVDVDRGLGGNRSELGDDGLVVGDGMDPYRLGVAGSDAELGEAEKVLEASVGRAMVEILQEKVATARAGGLRRRGQVNRIFATAPAVRVTVPAEILTRGGLVSISKLV
jgi:hypothetical protein